MKKPMLFLAQLSVAVAVILVWHIFTGTHLLGNPAKAKFFFATPGDVAHKGWTINRETWKRLADLLPAPG